MAEAVQRLGPYGFPYMAKVHDPGRRGDVRIEHLTITDRGGIHAQLHGYGTENGTYAVLRIGNRLVMSDTTDERRSNMWAVHKATGDVLIGGLGLGMVVCAMLLKPEVRSITVLEVNPDVIALVEPAIRVWDRYNVPLGYEGRLHVIQGDVFSWKPTPRGTKYDAIYFDIWDDICTDNLRDIARLHNRAKGWRSPGAYMDSWQAENLRLRARREH